MDILDRLRRSVTKGHEPADEDAIDAAAEIERLRAELHTIGCIARDPLSPAVPETLHRINSIALRALGFHYDQDALEQTLPRDAK